MGGEGFESGASYGDRSSGEDIAKLVHAAIDGDQLAWNSLVDRFTGLLWSICRSYGLSGADAADAFQMTWLRLLEHLDSIHDPARLPAWLATTCRRECLAVIRRAKRTRPVAADRLGDHGSVHAESADEPSLLSAGNAELWRAFRRLTQRCQEILRLLIVEAENGPPSYELAAVALQMPVGSLGPTRARCLDKLRKLLDTQAY